MTHICIRKLTIIVSDNGLSPGRGQAIIWTNAGILLIRTLGTNFSEILGKIHSFSFKKMHLKISSVKGHLFSLGLNELMALYGTSQKLCVHLFRLCCPLSEGVGCLLEWPCPSHCHTLTFLHFSRQTTHRIGLKFGGLIHYGDHTWISDIS